MPLSVQAKRFVPETARQLTLFVKAVCVQLVPVSVERKTPPPVPAKRFVPETARQPTFFVKAVCVQLVPVSVERKTPQPVPAKRFVPETAKQLILPKYGPLACTHCADANGHSRTIASARHIAWVLILSLFGRTGRGASFKECRKGVMIASLGGAYWVERSVWPKVANRGVGVPSSLQPISDNFTTWRAGRSAGMQKWEGSRPYCLSF